MVWTGQERGIGDASINLEYSGDILHAMQTKSTVNASA